MEPDKRPIAVKVSCAPFSEKHVNEFTPGGVGQNVAFALLRPLQMGKEERKDWITDVYQQLLATRETAEFDALVKRLMDSTVKRRDVHLTNALSYALKLGASHRETLPVERVEQFDRPGNSPGVWHILPRPLEEVQEGGEHDIAVYRNTLVKQSKCGWKEWMHVPLDSISSVCDTWFVVASRVGSQIQVRRFPLDLVEAAESFACTIYDGDGALHHVSYNEGMFVVGLDYVVLVWKRGAEFACAHYITHPKFTLDAGVPMITACLLRNEEELVIGTTLGALWNVHPTDAAISNRFIEFQKIVPIRAIRSASGGTVICAVTVSEIFLVPNDADFVRSVSCMRAIDVALVGNALFAQTKYGCVLVYDLEHEGSPLLIEPPAEQCLAMDPAPWYQGCWVSENGHSMVIMYPDGLCRRFAL